MNELLELAARAIRPTSDYDFTPSRLHHRAVYGRRDPARAELVSQFTFPPLSLNLDEMFRVCGDISRASVSVLTPEQIAALFKPEKEVVREPVTQAKIDRVFGLSEKRSEEIEAMAEKGRRSQQAQRLFYRWRNAHPQASFEEEQQFIDSIAKQGFEV